MDNKWLLFAGILIVNAIIAFFLAISMGRKGYAAGTRSMAAMFTTLAIWTFAYAMITLAADLPDKIFWLKIENIGITTFASFWIFFALEYTKNGDWLKLPVRALFFIVPGVTLTLLFSGVWFNFYYKSAMPAEGAFGPLVISRGPWYLAQFIQTYALLIVGFVLLLWHMFRLREVYRRQLFFVLAAVVLPLLLNIYYQTGGKLIPSLPAAVDLAPISFTITAALISIGVFGLGLFDLVPIARNVVMENIPEMVIVIDTFNRILDVNQTTLDWLKKPAREVIGGDLMRIFNFWPGLGGIFNSGDNVQQELTVGGNPPRTLELIVSTIHSHAGNIEGRVIVARDISYRKQMEVELKKANELLQSQLAENEALRLKLQDQAVRDPLTNVFNRRFMAEALDVETARAQREHQTLTIVIIDLDHFKQLNDTYGHRAGDLILQAFAKLLMKDTRRSDIVCRFGGEEFVVLMPDASLDSAKERAEKWRQTLEKMITEYEGRQLSISFSAGVASYPDQGNTGDEVLRAADKALYQSKSQGRNRVTVYDHSLSVQEHPHAN